jgi:putative transcriptional regulator
MGQSKLNASSASLEGQLLIAMPTIGDPRFDRAVILMCSHGPEGAMGIVLNKHVGNMRFSDLLEQLDIEAENIAPDPPIHFGGPVDMGRGFVIHSKDYDVAEQTVKVTGSIHLTATIEILKAMARGKGPKRAVLALGYAGWAPGQLEMEIQANAWLNCAADDQLVFDEAIDRQWSRALKSLGAEALTLSTEAGHA